METLLNPTAIGPKSRTRDKLSEDLQNQISAPYDDSELRELIRQDAQNLEDFSERMYGIAEGLQEEIVERATISDLQGFATYVDENYATKDELSDKADKDYVDASVKDKVDASFVESALAGYATTEEVSNAIASAITTTLNEEV